MTLREAAVWGYDPSNLLQLGDDEKNLLILCWRVVLFYLLENS